jgi:hypothetical protein
MPKNKRINASDGDNNSSKTKGGFSGSAIEKELKKLIVRILTGGKGEA